MTKAWFDETETLELFYSEVAEEMIARRMLRAKPESALHNDAVLACVADFIGEVAPITHFSSLNEAIEAILGWLKGSVAQPKPEGQRIEAFITRNLGDVSIGFGYSAIFEISSPGQRRSAFAFCIAEIEKQFDAHTTGIAVSRAVSSASSEQIAGETDTFLGDTIIVEIKDNKPYYKIKGGQYSKFGVRVWPETLIEAGMKPELLQGGKEYKLGRICHALLIDGKAKKVVKILNA